jgi:hypothetical protein
MRTIVVRVPSAAEDSILGSRLHDVADEIYCQLGMDGTAEIPSLDSFTTEFRVVIHSTRDLGVVTTCIKKSLRRHGLADLAEICRVAP